MLPNDDDNDNILVKGFLKLLCSYNTPESVDGSVVLFP